MANLADTLLSNAPFERRMTRRGWVTFNCPCCIAAGEPSPDDIMRGGLLIETDLVRYWCFRCGTSAYWSPGQLLDRKMRFVLHCFGVSQQEINRLAFEAARTKQSDPSRPTISADTSRTQEFTAIALPDGAKPLWQWLNDPACPQDAVDVAEYLCHRRVADLYEYYWTPTNHVGFNRRAIIPFRHRRDIVGWTARYIDSDEKYPRYYTSQKSHHYLFNIDVLRSHTHKFVVIVEGPIDAIAIDGLGTLGKVITTQQRAWINQSGKTPIILADRDPGKHSLYDYAESNRWLISFPWEFYGGDGAWDRDIKDAAAAVQRYGQLFTIKTIIDYSHANYQRIGLIEETISGKVRFEQ